MITNWAFPSFRADLQLLGENTKAVSLTLHLPIYDLESVVFPIAIVFRPCVNKILGFTRLPHVWTYQADSLDLTVLVLVHPQPTFSAYKPFLHFSTHSTIIYIIFYLRSYSTLFPLTVCSHSALYPTPDLTYVILRSSLHPSTYATYEYRFSDTFYILTTPPMLRSSHPKGGGKPTWRIARFLFFSIHFSFVPGNHANANGRCISFFSL